MIIFILLVCVLSFFEIREIKQGHHKGGIILYIVLASFALFLGITYISDPFGHSSISQFIFRIINMNY